MNNEIRRLVRCIVEASAESNIQFEEIQAEIAKQYGVKVGIHNHLGTPVETQEQLEEFLTRCPNCYIVFDIGHHHGAGGDPLYIIEKYFDRLFK